MLPTAAVRVGSQQIGVAPEPSNRGCWPSGAFAYDKRVLNFAPLAKEQVIMKRRSRHRNVQTKVNLLGSLPAPHNATPRVSDVDIRTGRCEVAGGSTQETPHAYLSGVLLKRRARIIGRERSFPNT